MTTHEALQILDLTTPISREALTSAYEEGALVWLPERFEGNAELHAKAVTKRDQLYTAYLRLWELSDEEFPYQVETRRPAPQLPRIYAPMEEPLLPRRAEPDILLETPQQEKAEPGPPKQAPKAMNLTAWLVVSFGLAGLTVFFAMQFFQGKPQEMSTETASLPPAVHPPPTTPAKSRWQPGMPRDVERALAEQGDVEAQNQMGIYYELGNGVAKDLVIATEWYTKSAEQGNPVAQENLAYCYIAGKGVAINFAEAVKWYRLAADQGYARAENGLGACYEGGYGVTQDHALAAQWYAKAAAHGNENSYYRLGLFYAEGRGVKKDLVEALKWQIMAEPGVPKAGLERDKLNAQLTPDQCEQARLQALKFLNAVVDLLEKKSQKN